MFQRSKPVEEDHRLQKKIKILGGFYNEKE